MRKQPRNEKRKKKLMTFYFHLNIETRKCCRANADLLCATVLMEKKLRSLFDATFSARINGKMEGIQNQDKKVGMKYKIGANHG